MSHILCVICPSAALIVMASNAFKRTHSAQTSLLRVVTALSLRIKSNALITHRQHGEVLGLI